MATKTYKPKRKISETESEEIKIPASSVSGLSTVATSGSYNDLIDQPTIPDVSGKANVSGQAFTGGISAPNISTGNAAENYFQSQKFRGEGNADTYYHAVDFGYAGHNQVDFHEYGGVYNFRQNTVGSSDGGVLVGAFTPDGIKEGETLLKDKYLGKSGGTVTGDLTVGGNLTINGTTTTVDSTTLQVKDKLIEVAHGNTAALTTPAGLVAPKYDGTNSGALVFDSTGTAYVGDVTLKDGNIDVANSGGLQPIATRTGLVGGNLVQYDSSAQTLKDSGKKISDLALKTDVSGKLSKTENTGVNVLGTTKSTTTLGGNQLVAPNGIIFAGTAANAGLVTRGICGVSTPDSKGACSKDNLYINYDNTNTYNTGRMLILQAGETGTDYGNNMYQYAVPRGDIVKAWVEAKGYLTSQDISGKANLEGGNTFSGVQTINAPTDVSGSETTTLKAKTSNGGSIVFGKEGPNSGTMIRLDQADGTCRLRFRGSSTAGAMVWEQPEQGAQLYVDLGKDGSDKHRVTFPSSAGTLALTSQVDAKYAKPSGGIPKTDLANAVQTSLGKADTALQSETDPTVPSWAKASSKPTYTASEVGALSLDGGTIKKSKTIKMDASANSDGANLKWGTVNSKNPYIGYASDQTDGTFVIGSLLGTNYASGLAIGGGSGNLLWKGTKVATTSDIPNVPKFNFENGVLTITT